MAPFANFVTRELAGHRRRVHSVAWNCTGRKLASGSVDQTARVYDVEHGSHSGRDVELKGHSDSVDQVSWDPSCLLYTSPSPRDRQKSRMPSSA